jgi:hypothetical protein
MGFNEQRLAIQRELDRITHEMNVLIPRYTLLLKRANLSQDELEELGEMEHFLFGLTNQISEMKAQLEHDVYGNSTDFYFKLKKAAQNGDAVAQKKLEKLRETFHDSLQNSGIISWN